MILRQVLSPISRQKKKEAYKAVFADAVSFEVVISGENELESYLDENGYGAQNIDGVMLAKDDQGNELGYAFTVTTSEGYGGDIQFAMGVKDDGTLNGISILSISETQVLECVQLQMISRTSLRTKRWRNLSIPKQVLHPMIRLML